MTLLNLLHGLGKQNHLLFFKLGPFIKKCTKRHQISAVIFHFLVISDPLQGAQEELQQ